VLSPWPGNSIVWFTVSTTGSVRVGSNVDTTVSRSKPCIVPLPDDVRSMNVPAEASPNVWARRNMFSFSRITKYSAPSVSGAIASPSPLRYVTFSPVSIS